MKINTAVRILAIFAMASVGNAGVRATDMMQDKSLMIPAGELKWEPYAPGSPLQVAPLWGDRSAPGDHGMLLKLPAGFEAGLHSHTLTYHAVALQGKWVHTDEMKNTKELGPMSYVQQLGKANHNDVCKGPEDCIIFIHQDGPGDFIPAPAEPAGKTNKMKK
jgi:hypothetical protein